MANGLIGYSGFVGSTLLKQTVFESLYRSTNINTIIGKSFDIVVCSGASAKKWMANCHPKADWQKIQSLIENLKTIQCRMFILISTVDVFKNPVGVDEETTVEESGLHPYGLHRLLLENFVQSHFKNFLIVRLPGLIGPGLRKNVIYDFLNENNLSMIDSRGVFQFYPMINLWRDIQCAFRAGLKMVHLTAEPMSVAEVSLHGFGKKFDQILGEPPSIYDMRSRYVQAFGARGHYQYSVQQILQNIRLYAQSEPLGMGA